MYLYYLAWFYVCTQYMLFAVIIIIILSFFAVIINICISSWLLSEEKNYRPTKEKCFSKLSLKHLHLNMHADIS